MTRMGVHAVAGEDTLAGTGQAGVQMRRNFRRIASSEATLLG